MRGRKGISPLIATVLLLAFAVAIGTMVVGYIVDATRTEPCDQVQIAFQEGVPACYQNERVSFLVTNRGEEPISSIMVKIINPRGEVVENRVSLSLLTGRSSKAEVPYRTVGAEGVQLVITPALTQGDKEKFCFEKEVKTALQVCNN